MVISGKSGEAVRGFPLSTVAPALAQVAYPMDRSGTRPALSPTGEVNTGGNTMTETLTAPVADAFADALHAGSPEVGRQATAEEVLGDYRGRYLVALAASERTVNDLRLHRRRGASLTRTHAPEGTTYAERLATFGITKQDGTPITGEATAQIREANVFDVIATIRPSLWNVDTLAWAYDRDAFGLWADVDKAARAGFAKGKDGEPSALIRAARTSLLVVMGKATPVQPGGSAQYEDPFSDAAWPWVEAEFSARLALIVDSAQAVKDARAANKDQVDDAQREAKSALDVATGEGAASVRTSEDVSTSEGSEQASRGADSEPGPEPEVLSLEVILSSLRTSLSLLTDGGKHPLPKSARESFYSVVREFTESK